MYFGSMMVQQHIRWVLFDMDGVLVNSEPVLAEAAMMVFAEQWVQVSSTDFLPFIGKWEEAYLLWVAQKYGLDVDVVQIQQRLYEIYYTLIPTKLSLIPWVVEFITKCRNLWLTLALATSADFDKVQANFSAVNLSLQLFDAIVNGLEVRKKKPFPDIFIEAAHKLWLEPTSCLVVEDSIHGVIAAKTAWCKCLALTTTFERKDLQDADWIVDTFFDVPFEVLSW